MSSRRAALKSSCSRQLALATVVGAGLGAAMWTSGWPRRVGLTKSEALLSLPGDLLIPMSAYQADRVIRVNGDPAGYWAELLRLEERYESLWGRPLDLAFEEGDCAAWVTPDDGSSPWTASLSISAIPDVDGTGILWVRERYSAATYRTRRFSISSALMAPFMWAHVKQQYRKSKVAK